IDEGWSGKGELGIALSRGNTESESLIGKVDVGFSSQRRKFAAGAWGQYASTDGVESARRFGSHVTSGWRLDERRYLYGSLRSERDAFGTYEYQWTATAGYGYEVFRTDTHRLFFEAGPGYRYAKDQGARVHHREGIGRALVDWSLKVTDTATLTDTLLVEAGRKNTFARNLFGVQVAVNKKLAMKAGLEPRYNSDVEPGIATTDNPTTVHLVYSFKSQTAQSVAPAGTTRTGAGGIFTSPVAVPHRVRNPMPDGGVMSKLLHDRNGQLRNGWWMLVFIVVFLASQLVYRPVSKGLQLLGVEPSWFGPLPVAFLLLATWLCMRLRRQPLSAIGLKLDASWFRQLAAGVGLGSALMLVVGASIMAIGGVRFTMDPAGGLAALAYGTWFFVW